MNNLKKTILAALAAFCLLAAFPAPSAAKVYIDLAAPQAKRIPIAMQDFKYSGPSPASSRDKERIESVKAELLDALTSDIRFTGFFSVVNSDSFIEDPEKAGLTADAINFRDWRAVGADNLIKGSFVLEKDRLTVEARLFDCVNETQLIGKRYTGSAANPRKLIHYFMDALYEELTGKKGVFTTKVLFISDQTGKKEVYMADYDGKNASQITMNRTINLSPQWSPDGKKIIYVSYKKGTPSLYMLDLATGKDRALSSKQGVNIGGRFSPDGTKVALTLSGPKSPELFLIDLNGNTVKQLTDNHAIDVSPSWSPDGAKLAFVSDVSGNPQIYVLDLATGTVKRLTYGGKYNSSPAWSPDGKLVAFSRSDSGRFNIWVMQPDGGSLTQLTFDGNNRNPSWSPDGRHIIFSSQSKDGTGLFIMQADGTGLTKVSTGTGNEKFPAWSPFLR